MTFPIVSATVDVAVLRTHKGKQQVILGRKDKEDGWCFPGGFVDPSDLSLMAAAQRELSEEVTCIRVGHLTVLGSAKIDDPRFEGTQDGIMTTFFLTSYLDGDPVAGDDLDEVRWFDLTDDLKDILVHKHKILLQLLTY